MLWLLFGLHRSNHSQKAPRTYWKLLLDAVILETAIAVVSFVGCKITASMPVIVDQRLVGVVSVDIDLNKASRRTAQLDGDDYSYYFLIALNGDTYYHPMLSSPSDADEPPVMVSIGILEKEALAAGVIASMMRCGIYRPL